MRLCQAILLLSLAAGAPAVGEEKGGKDDGKNFDGVWVVESIISNGQKVPDEEVRRLTVVIEGEKYTLKRDGEVIEEGGTKVDASKTPNTIVVTPSSGPNKGVKLYGIAEADRGRIKAHVGKERPKDFTPREGTVLIIYKRKADR